MPESDNTEKTPALIGVGLLGIITAGMYDSPLCMYREYIQNSADALAGSVHTCPARVDITLDPTARRVRIRDNGPGLSYEDALNRLLPIGRSNKTLGIDRGFRGIGRLAALPFAQSVSFLTRTCPTEPVSRITWHSDRLPDLSESGTQLEQAIRNCVDLDTLSGSEYPDHFFEVEVSEVAHHSAGLLLNRDAVRSYVGEVCPVPMSAAFPFRNQVRTLLNVSGPLLALNINLEGDPTPVKRPYTDAIDLSSTRSDEFTAFEEIRIPSTDGNGDAAIGWVAHSSYLGALPKESRVRGIRARVGNIQIGDESVFDELFAEERFNRWCVGEVHIVDHRIIPNAKRDYFQPGPHLRNLENQLKPVLRDISSKCRRASVARNQHKKALTALCNIEGMYDLAVSGYLAMEDSEVLVDRALQDAEQVRQRVREIGLGKSCLDRLDVIELKLKEFNREASLHQFDNILPEEVTVYQKIFRAVVAIETSPSAAKEFIEAVLTEAPNGPEAIPPE